MKKLFSVFLAGLFCCFFFSQMTVAQSQNEGAGSSLEACDDKTQTKSSSGFCVDISEPFVREYDMKEGKLKPVVSVRGGDGIEMFSNYVSIIYRYAASIIGIICVLIMVISGIQIIAGGASSESVTEAKKRIFLAFGSLALLFMIGLILRTINPGFFG